MTPLTSRIAAAVGYVGRPPDTARPTRFVLDASSWGRARLSDDTEAMAWLAELEESNTGSVISAELISEGVLRYHRKLNTILSNDGRFSSCICVPRWRCHERDDDWLTVRRRYTGPVPPQVLAAFEATP